MEMKIISLSLSIYIPLPIFNVITSYRVKEYNASIVNFKGQCKIIYNFRGLCCPSGLNITTCKTHCSSISSGDYSDARFSETVSCDSTCHNVTSSMNGACPCKDGYYGRCCSDVIPTGWLISCVLRPFES